MTPEYSSPDIERASLIVDFSGPDDEYNQLNWPFAKKSYTSLLYSLASLGSVWASTAYAPANAKIADEFGVSSEAALVGISLLLLGRLKNQQREEKEVQVPGLAVKFGLRPLQMLATAIFLAVAVYSSFIYASSTPAWRRSPSSSSRRAAGTPWPGRCPSWPCCWASWPAPLGNGWAFTVLGVFAALNIPIPFLFSAYERQIRARGKFMSNME